MDVKAALDEHFRTLRGLKVRTKDGEEIVGRVIFLDDQLAEIHPAPRHRRASAIPRYKVRVAEISAVGPAPGDWDDTGGGRTAEELRAMVGPQEAVFLTKKPA